MICPDLKDAAVLQSAFASAGKSVQHMAGHGTFLHGYGDGAIRPFVMREWFLASTTREMRPDRRLCIDSGRCIRHAVSIQGISITDLDRDAVHSRIYAGTDEMKRVSDAAECRQMWIFRFPC